MFFPPNTNILINKSLLVDASESKLQVISFSCSKKLVPSTKYTISLQATGTVGENIISRRTSFTTPQSVPSSPTAIQLICKDMTLSPASALELKVEIPKTLGYWSKNSSGYEKILIVNGKSVKTKNIKNVKNVIAEKFTIKDEFGYDCKIDDIVQIGIRVWATDDEGKKIYDAPTIKTSNAVCFMNNSIQAYLNVK